MCVFLPWWSAVSDNILINNQRQQRNQQGGFLPNHLKQKKEGQEEENRIWWKPQQRKFDYKFNFSKTYVQWQGKKWHNVLLDRFFFYVLYTAISKTQIPLCPACVFASVCIRILREISHSVWNSDASPFSLLSPTSWSLLCIRMGRGG